MGARLLIAFYSRSGSVEGLAKAIAEGATEAGGEVRLRRAREVVPPDVMALAPGWTESAARMNAAYEAPTTGDAEWANAIALGSPTRFGSLASELRAFVDTLGGLWFQGKLHGKAAGAFTSTSTPHGGNETTLLSTYISFAHFGMVIVPPGYGDPVMFRAGTPYGASSVSHGQSQLPPTEDDLAVARFQGRRLAQVASALDPS